MDPSFYQRLSRMRWSVFESLNWWPMNGSQFHQPTCCLGMRKLLPVATLMWVLRKTGPTSHKTAFIQLDLPSSSDRPLALYSSAVSESAWRGGIHKENLMQSRLIYFVGSASILFTMLCSPHLAFVIFESLPSSLFLSIPQVNQEILSFFVFRINKNEKCRSCSCLFSKISFLWRTWWHLGSIANKVKIWILIVVFFKFILTILFYGIYPTDHL